MSTNTDEVLEFLGIAAQKGFLNDNTAVARRTACNKFFDILDPDQKSVEYVRDHLDVIKARFSNLNKEVAGTTVEEYSRRVQRVLNDFDEWKADRAGWERRVSAKQSARNNADGEKKPRSSKPEKTKAPSAAATNGTDHRTNGRHDSETRTVTFPIRPNFDLSITLPRSGITVDELRKLVYFLLPYAQDWEPTQSARAVFPILERDEVIRA